MPFQPEVSFQRMYFLKKSSDFWFDFWPGIPALDLRGWLLILCVFSCVFRGFGRFVRVFCSQLRVLSCLESCGAGCSGSFASLVQILGRPSGQRG